MEIGKQITLRSKVMKIIVSGPFAVLLFFLLVGFDVRGAGDRDVVETRKIDALIQKIEELNDAKFIRNNSEYDSKTAAKFLRGKLKSQSKEIKNANDFIEKAASVSSTSGKSYVIRFKDGRKINCGDYLKTELKRLENKSKADA